MEIFRSHFRELPVVTSALMHFRELPVPPISTKP